MIDIPIGITVCFNLVNATKDKMPTNITREIIEILVVKYSIKILVSNGSFISSGMINS